MTLVRETVVDALKLYLPDDVVVDGYSRLSLTTISRPHVLVKLEEVRPEPSSPMSHRRYVLALILVVPLTEAPAADDLLDGLLEDLLYALEQAPQVGFESATRAVFEGTTTPAYDVRCYLIADKPAPPQPTE